MEFIKNLSKKQKFLLAIAFQLAVLSVSIISGLSVMLTGTEVTLQIMPVDPRDPLRGDYVTFSYDISRVNPNYYYPRPDPSDYSLPSRVSVSDFRNGDTVYVVLKQSGKYWRVAGVSRSKPDDNSVFIKGKVQSGGVRLGETANLNNNQMVNVVYGIEDYFIPEGKGAGLNRLNTARDNYAVVSIDSNGDAVLKKIYIDDKPWP